jgi:hypothetical protein
MVLPVDGKSVRTKDNLAVLPAYCLFAWEGMFAPALPMGECLVEWTTR